MTKLNKKRRNSFIEQRLYLAASRWIRVKKQQSIRLKEKGPRKSKWQQKKKNIMIDKKLADGLL